MGNFKTVLGFHLKESLTAKSFIITASILFLVIIGFFAATHYINDEDRDVVHVIVENDFYSLDLENLNESQNSIELKELEKNNIEEMKEEVRKGNEDGVLVISKGTELPQVEYFYKNNPDYNLISLIQPELQSQYIKRTVMVNKIELDVAETLLSKVSIEQTQLKETESTGLVYFFIFLMYFFIVMFGQQVAMAITGEKTTRVMEIMITKAKPLTMMYAKIISLMTAGIIQVTIVGLAYIIANLLGWTSGDITLMGMPLDLSVLSIKMFLFFIVYFVMGYILYALIFASAASVVTRVEEIGSIIFPVTMLLFGGTFLGFKSIFNPNDTLVLIGSYIPFFSPLVTFSRIALDEASLVEIIGSLAILITTIFLLSIFASKVYKNGVMRYKNKATIKDVFLLAKNKD